MISTYTLALFGLVGVATLGLALIFDTTWWSNEKGQQWASLATFAIVLLGAVGFLIMDRNHLLGAALAVIGGLTLALILFWAVVPLVLGVGAAVVAVLRARALNERDRVPATSV